MVRLLQSFLVRRDGAAAAEMALILPILLVLMFGSIELGNLFLDQHALSKQVRDGARFASRLPLSSTYSCPTDVFEDSTPTADAKILNVTKNGVVEGAGKPRWDTTYWARNCTGQTTTLQVTYRCVDRDAAGLEGIYTGLEGDLAVVKVTGRLKYRSLLAPVGINAVNTCLTAEAEAAVIGL